MSRVVRPKIIIAGWHDDSNKGDAAILLSLLKVLDTFLPDAEFYIQLSVHYSNTSYPTMLRHTRCLFPKPVADLTSLFRATGESKPLKTFRFMVSLIRSFILLLFPKFALSALFNSREKTSLATYFEAACIVGKGGHYFYGGKQLPDLVKAYIQAFPFLLGRRLNIPYVFVGISIGPFRSWLERIIPKLVFTGASAISAREGESFEEICYLIGSRDRVYRTTDTALWLGSTLDRRKTSEKEYVIFCPRVVFPKDKRRAKYTAYLSVSKWLIQELTTSFHRRVVVVLTAVSPFEKGGYNTTEDDRQFVLDLQGEGLDLSNVDFVVEDLDPIALLDVFANAEFVIGTRLHSVIFALLCGKPFIAISYYGPKARIVTDYQMGDFVVDISELERGALKTILENIIRKENELVRTIQERLDLSMETVLGDGALQAIVTIVNRVRGRGVND